MGASRARPAADAAVAGRPPGTAPPSAELPPAELPPAEPPPAEPPPLGLQSQDPPSAPPAAAAPLAVIEFAAEQLLRDAAGPDALPAILGRLAAAFGARAALVLRHTTTSKPVVLAAHPEKAASDPVLLAAVGMASAEHDLAAAGGMAQTSLKPPGPAGGSPMSVLLASPAPAGGEPLCTLALIGDASGWNAQTRAAARVLAAMMTAQIRHADDVAHLAERRALSAGLIRGSPDPIVAANSARRIVEFNPAAERLLGWQRDEALGKRLPDLLLPVGDRARFHRDSESYLRSGDRGEFVGRMLVPVLLADGSQRLVELTPVPLTIEGEVHFCGFLRDVTELERAQLALAESEARFRLLAQVAPVGIVQTDMDGNYTFVNDRWCALAGISARDAAGANWTRAVHPDDAARVRRQWARAAGHGAELRTDCRLRPTAGGRQTWVHAAVAAMPGPGGQPAGFLAAITNISDRKRAEAEREQLLVAEQRARRSLADQTERLNSLIATAIPGILFTDELGLITQLNESFCDMLGIGDEPGELIGAPAAELLSRIKQVFADPAEFVRRIGEASAGRLPRSGEQMVCTDGRTLECDYWPVFVEGDYRGNLWLAWDMSERAAMEEQRERMLAAELAAREMAEQAQRQLAEQNMRLRELDHAKTQFLATVSHELRTPLTSIVSFTELVREDEQDLTPDTAAFLDIIQRNAERLLHLVGDLLLLSRIEAGSIPLDLAPVCLPRLLEEAVRSASAAASQRGVVIDFCAQEGPPVRADQIRLRQVFDNLLSNAAKFSARGSWIRVTATHDDRSWRTDVEDCGIGIPPAELEKIFDRFVRASNARTASLPGSGLGLSVVKAITELHGGRVEASSAVGSGTTFTVHLPVSP